MMNEKKPRPGRKPADRLGRVDLVLGPELRRRIRIAAAMSDVSMGTWLRAAAEAQLAREAHDAD